MSTSKDEKNTHEAESSGAARAILIRSLKSVFKNPMKLFKPKRGKV
jgi:hypothetical protein